MATYILIHGGNMSADTWNRLSGRHDYPEGTQIGAKYWDGTAAFLREHGHRVFAPALENEHTDNLTDHIGQIITLMETEVLRDVILVGHSYGGMVITGVASRMADRVRRLVYIDAALPDPGQSLFDIFSEGGVDPLSFPGLEAAAAYVEKLQFDRRTLEQLPKTYILCTGSEFAVVTRGAKKKITANPLGWTYLELPTSHVPMATMSDRLDQLLLSVAEE
jgi:pimeloyl-ACP methyl ester carboxylesterase